MPQMVTYFLEGEPRLDEMAGTRVTQAMGPPAFPSPAFLCGRQT